MTAEMGYIVDSKEDLEIPHVTSFPRTTVLARNKKIYHFFICRVPPMTSLILPLGAMMISTQMIIDRVHQLNSMQRLFNCGENVTSRLSSALQVLMYPVIRTGIRLKIATGKTRQWYMHAILFGPFS